MVFWNKDLLFCEISPTTYKISLKKENLKRHIQNFKQGKKFSKIRQEMILLFKKEKLLTYRLLVKI